MSQRRPGSQGPSRVLSGRRPAGDIGLGDAGGAQEFGDTMTAAIAAGRVACGQAAITTAKA
jgi:hypothetical protein